MTADIIIALITVGGTALSAFFGVIVASRLTNYRLEQLEKKVEKHNCLVERMVTVEQSCKSAHHRIDGIEGHHV